MARALSAARLKTVTWLLAASLFAAVVAILVLRERARLPLHFEADEPLIDRTVGAVARTARATPHDIERTTFPIVIHLSDRICVELRARPGTDYGGWVSCYDRTSGALIEEIGRGPDF